MISKSSSLASVAFEVCTALHRAGYTAVLTGGSAATFYAPRAYVSKDLDFVLTMRGSGGEDVLEALGYKRKHDYYLHPESVFLLEFPPGPLAIGDDTITTWDTVHRRKRLLHVLTPTDCCRDRLASFLFWNDFNGLEQALNVYRAQRKKVDLRQIRAWCDREQQGDKFLLFQQRISRGRNSPTT